MRFISATSPSAAEGLTAQVYAQIKRDFRLLKNPAGDSPFLCHSPAPELLAGFWSALYETVLVEHHLRRADKEAIAAAVSRANECQFCVDAHTLLGRVAGGGAGHEHSALAEWAEATNFSESAVLADPPFAADATPEAVGTAVLFQYTNRVVNVFLGQSRLAPAPAILRRPIEQLVGRYARGAVEWHHPPGRTLHLLPDAELPADLRWAQPSPHIASALARFTAVVEEAAGRELPQPARARVQATIGDWDGREPPLGKAWLDDGVEGLDTESQAVARLALTTAFASQRVDERTVAAFRSFRPTDAALVTAVAWAALTAAHRIGSWLVPDPAGVGSGQGGG